MTGRPLASVRPFEIDHDVRRQIGEKLGGIENLAWSSHAGQDGVSAEHRQARLDNYGDSLRNAIIQSAGRLREPSIRFSAFSKLSPKSE